MDSLWEAVLTVFVIGCGDLSEDCLKILSDETVNEEDF